MSRDLAGEVVVVLDRERHAEERPVVRLAAPGLGLVRLRQSALGEHDPERVQLRLDPLDPLEVDLDQLARGDLPLADQLRLAERPGICQLDGVHRAGIYSEYHSWSTSAAGLPLMANSLSSSSSFEARLHHSHHAAPATHGRSAIAVSAASTASFWRSRSCAPLASYGVRRADSALGYPISVKSSFFFQRVWSR